MNFDQIIEITLNVFATVTLVFSIWMATLPSEVILNATLKPFKVFKKFLIKRGLVKEKVTFFAR